MANLSGVERARYVERMFANIASHYDLMNRLMTFGQDVSWRRNVIQHTGLSSGSTLLDLGAGTGDLALEAVRQCPQCTCVAADFTIQMMQVGRTQHDLSEDGKFKIAWTAADAQRLPFESATFDAVVSGFLVRNLSDVLRSLREQYRVLKPGGRILILDTTPQGNTIIAPLVRLYLHRIIPFLGKLIAGSEEAYTYLPESTEGFLQPERLAWRMLQAGFRRVSYQRFMFGNVAIHKGDK